MSEFKANVERELAAINTKVPRYTESECRLLVETALRMVREGSWFAVTTFEDVLKEAKLE